MAAMDMELIQLTHERDTYKALWDSETIALDQLLIASSAAIAKLKAENLALQARINLIV